MNIAIIGVMAAAMGAVKVDLLRPRPCDPDGLKPTGRLAAFALPNNLTGITTTWSIELR